MTTLISTTTFDGLRSRFRGALLRPGEEGYDEARRVWNGAIDRRPALVARCAGTDDVVTAVRFARAQGLDLSVKGGGHSVAGHAVCDDGLMLDLSLVRAVRVDPEARIARVAGGSLWSDVDKATAPFGLAVTGGQISHTGVGGLTLAGGLGYLMRKHGLTVDSLLGVDLVTAEGERVRADADHEPELFWGLRGGGGNFGIATAFEFQLHPVGPIVLGGPVIWRLDDAPKVLAFLREFMPEAPDELGLAFVTRLAPPMPFIPPEHLGKPVLIALPVWVGDPPAGMAALHPLLDVATPIANFVRPAPYVALQSMLDGGAPHGLHYYWKSHRVPELSDAVIDVLTGTVDALTSPFKQIGAYVVGGAASRVPADATAVGDRAPGYELNITAIWPPSDPTPEAHVQWVRDVFHALEPHSDGGYANFVSDESHDEIAALYGDRLARLTALKDRWDPGNVFRHNANVVPSGRP